MEIQMLSSFKVSVIGAGNMAGSIIQGMLHSGFPAGNILATTKSEASQQRIKNQFGIQTTTDNLLATERADVILLCVKPAQAAAVLQELKPALTCGYKLLISVIAGITVETMTTIIGKAVPIIRTMPNTPSALQCGATGVFASESVSSQQKLTANKILESIGITLWVEQENLLHDITAISGSGPAYFFLFMEAMIEAAVEKGFGRDQAERLTLQTALGAAHMANESSATLAELREQVTSPGGITEQALKMFEQCHIRDTVSKAMEAAYKKSKENCKAIGE